MNAAANPRYAILRSTLAIAIAGSLLMWAALPPLAWGWLGWIAPVPWLLLVRTEQLQGRRPYGALWLAGLVFWLMAVHWLRLPHPATSLGWFALAAYLACYLPVFVGLSRVAVHSLHVPLWLAAPIVWTGLELARAHLLTGFLMGSIAHTQVNWTPLIQISDVVGEYGVDFLILMVASSITCIAFPPRRFEAIVPSTLVLAATLGYGYFRLGQENLNQLSADSFPPGPRIALIQGNSEPEWKLDPSREQRIMDEYLALSHRAIDAANQRGDGRPIDLIVWPETMFRRGLFSFDPGYQLPPELGITAEDIAADGRRALADLVARLNAPVLTGVDRFHVASSVTTNVEEQMLRFSPLPISFNSAALVGRDGKVIGTYDKNHRVMFGEYIPFADWMPFLYRLTPLTGGIAAGKDAAGLELDGVTYAPNICYETAIPHVIRRQVASLAARDESPDVLVNLTNDAWYRGSSELDMHLACDVYRAVETRKPLVIAANGGISAWIDQFGHIRAQLPRQQADVLIADLDHPRNAAMRSWYVELGDWFAAVCLACCTVLAVIGWRRSRQTPAVNPQ